MGEPSERRRKTAIAGLCVLVGAPLAYALARTEGSDRGSLLLRLAVVLAVSAVPPAVGRRRARRDAARGISPSSHRLTGVGLRDALLVVFGAILMGLGVLAPLVEPATGDGLSPAIPLGLGVVLMLAGIASGRQQRR